VTSPSPFHGHPGKLLADRLEIGADVLEDMGGDALAFDEQAEKKVLGADVRVMKAFGLLMRHGEGPFRALGERLKRIDATPLRALAWWPRSLLFLPRGCHCGPSRWLPTTQVGVS
jgi:hypothetical protein